MKKIIAVLGCSISSVICCLAAWKICEAGMGQWPWFLVSAIMLLFLTGAVSGVGNKEEDDE